jgi:hypothetical protein
MKRPLPSSRIGQPSDVAKDVTPDPVNWGTNLILYTGDGLVYTYRTRRITGIHDEITIKTIIEDSSPSSANFIKYKIDSESKNYHNSTQSNTPDTFDFLEAFDNDTFVVNNNDYITFTYSINIENSSLTLKIINVSDSDSLLGTIVCSWSADPMPNTSAPIMP